MSWVGSPRLWGWAFAVNAAALILNIGAVATGTRLNLLLVFVSAGLLVYLWKVKP